MALSKRDTYIRSNYFSSQTLNIPILLIIDQSLQKFSLGYTLSASLRVSPSSWPLKCSGRQKLAAQIKRQIVAQLPVWKKDSGTLNVYWLFETHLCITQSIIIRSRVTFRPFCRTNFEEKACRAYHIFGGFWTSGGRLGGGYSWKNITKPTTQHFFLVISLKKYYYIHYYCLYSLFLSPLLHHNKNTFTEIVLNRIVTLHWRTIQQLPIMS